MNWRKVLVAIAVCGAMSLFSSPILALQESGALLGEGSFAPVGIELSDGELLGVEGEADPLTIAATMIVYGGITAIGDLAIQLYSGDGVDWGEVGVSFGAGAVGGFAKIAAVPFVRAGLATALRWNAMAGAAIQRGFSVAARATGNVAYSAAKATSNAFKTAWNWITARLP